MFVVAEIKDTIRLNPQTLCSDKRTIILEALNRKYCDKVIPHVGLCITVVSIESVGDWIIYPGDGSPHVTVRAKYMVFRPMEGEIIEGKVRKYDESGIYVSLNFFENVHIPKSMLLENMVYGIDKLSIKGEGGGGNGVPEKRWMWYYEDDGTDCEDDEEDSEPFIVNVNAWIRFRVHSVSFTTMDSSGKDNIMIATTTTSGAVSTSTKTGAEGRSFAGKSEVGLSAQQNKATAEPTRMRRSRSISFEWKRNDGNGPPPPMRVIGSIADMGLGLIEWW